MVSLATDIGREDPDFPDEPLPPAVRARSLAQRAGAAKLVRFRRQQSDLSSSRRHKAPTPPVLRSNFNALQEAQLAAIAAAFPECVVDIFLAHKVHSRLITKASSDTDRKITGPGVANRNTARPDCIGILLRADASNWPQVLGRITELKLDLPAEVDYPHQCSLGCDRSLYADAVRATVLSSQWNEYLGKWDSEIAAKAAEIMNIPDVMGMTLGVSTEDIAQQRHPARPVVVIYLASAKFRPVGYPPLPTPDELGMDIEYRTGAFHLQAGDAWQGQRLLGQDQLSFSTLGGLVTKNNSMRLNEGDEIFAVTAGHAAHAAQPMFLLHQVDLGARTASEEEVVGCLALKSSIGFPSRSGSSEQKQTGLTQTDATPGCKLSLCHVGVVQTLPKLDSDATDTEFFYVDPSAFTPDHVFTPLTPLTPPSPHRSPLSPEPGLPLSPPICGISSLFSALSSFDTVLPALPTGDFVMGCSTPHLSPSQFSDTKVKSLTRMRHVPEGPLGLTVAISISHVDLKWSETSARPSAFGVDGAAIRCHAGALRRWKSRLDKVPFIGEILPPSEVRKYYGLPKLDASTRRKQRSLVYSSASRATQRCFATPAHVKFIPLSARGWISSQSTDNVRIAYQQLCLHFLQSETRSYLFPRRDGDCGAWIFTWDGHAMASYCGGADAQSDVGFACLLYPLVQSFRASLPGCDHAEKLNYVMPSSLS